MLAIFYRNALQKNGRFRLCQPVFECLQLVLNTHIAIFFEIYKIVQLKLNFAKCCIMLAKSGEFSGSCKFTVISPTYYFNVFQRKCAKRLSFERCKMQNYTIMYNLVDLEKCCRTDMRLQKVGFGTPENGPSKV